MKRRIWRQLFYKEVVVVDEGFDVVLSHHLTGFGSAIGASSHADGLSIRAYHIDDVTFLEVSFNADHADGQQAHGTLAAQGLCGLFVDHNASLGKGSRCGQSIS